MSVKEFIKAEMKKENIVPLERLVSKIEDEILYAQFCENMPIYEQRLHRDLKRVISGDLDKVAVGRYISLDEAKGIVALKLDAWERYCEIAGSTSRKRYHPS